MQLQTVFLLAFQQDVHFSLLRPVVFVDLIPQGLIKGSDHPKNAVPILKSLRTYSKRIIHFQIYSYGKEKCIFWGKVAFSLNIKKSQKNNMKKVKRLFCTVWSAEQKYVMTFFFFFFYKSGTLLRVSF